jgi:hypothetical protein
LALQSKRNRFSKISLKGKPHSVDILMETFVACPVEFHNDEGFNAILYEYYSHLGYDAVCVRERQTDFRLLLHCSRDLHFSGMLCSLGWQLVTNVPGLLHP